MAENNPPREGKQAGGCSAVFPEPEAAADGISGLRGCTYLQQSGRKRHSPLCGRQKELAVLRQCQGCGIQTIVYSLVETAKVKYIEPYEYLLFVVSMLPYLGKSPAHEELEKLMPWHPAVQHRVHIRKPKSE